MFTVTELKCNRPNHGSGNELRRRMAAWVVAQVLEKPRQRAITPGQRAGPEVNGVDDGNILAHHLHLELGDGAKKGLRRSFIALIFSRRENRKDAGVPGTRQRKRRHGAEPSPLDSTALVIDVVPVNADAIIDRFAQRVTSLEIVQHRMIGPFDAVMRVLLLEG